MVTAAAKRKSVCSDIRHNVWRFCLHKQLAIGILKNSRASGAILSLTVDMTTSTERWCVRCSFDDLTLNRPFVCGRNYHVQCIVNKVHCAQHLIRYTLPDSYQMLRLWHWDHIGWRDIAKKIIEIKNVFYFVSSRCNQVHSPWYELHRKPCVLAMEYNSSMFWMARNMHMSPNHPKQPLLKLGWLFFVISPTNLCFVKPSFC